MPFKKVVGQKHGHKVWHGRRSHPGARLEERGKGCIVRCEDGDIG